MAAAKTIYEYLVIGGGSGGLASARRASSYGKKVLLIENQTRIDANNKLVKLGGTCVNVGCVPKKVMWNAASIAEAFRDASCYEFAPATAEFDWHAFKNKRDAYVKRLNGIYESNLQKDQVDTVHGTASFKDKNTVLVDGKEYSAKHILIASGGQPIIPNIPGADLGISSDGFFDLEKQPKRVAVVGTGYIGVELAGIFHALGSTTTIFSRTEHILRTFDDIIRVNLRETMEKSGVQFEYHSNVTRLSGQKNGPIQVEFESKNATKTETKTLEVDCVLWAIGRKPNTELLQLDKAGIEVDKRGHIVVDDFQRTNMAGESTDEVLALGDVCNKNAELTPVAIAAGRRLGDRLFGGERFKESHLDYSNVPTVVFSHPTAGTIGLTEEKAREKYGDKEIRVYSSKFINMYFAMMEPEKKESTAYKIVVAGPEEKVVGLHIFGRASDEILQGFGVAMRMGATKADFDNCVAIHPTAAEELVTMR